MSRVIMVGFLASGLCLVLGAPAHAEEKVRIDAETKKATAKALEWLAKQQNPDGSWSSAQYQHNTAMTAYALLAFMAQGHVPAQGLYGPEVAKGCRFLMASARTDGYLIGVRGGNMYCHGIATLALAELWGMTGDEEVKPVLKKAIDLIVGCQSPEGGWRYNPDPTGADISVTIMQVMALRSAKNGGMHVPDETLKKAIDYINRCYEPRSGGFQYQPGSQAPGFARTSAGACVLQLTGKYDAKEIPKAIEFLETHFNERHYWFYGQYYACHAMHQVGGEKWEKYYKRLRDTLLPKQSADGSWNTNDLDTNAVGPVYQTSIAVLVLSVPAHYLPIFQR
jgi:squalene cyclase